ncbi:serine hydrolase [Roseivirga sp.]|uniref:serine hydrolase n=1 Tax=Roseivirga sp. TaxID=1964215 RepID=UPI003B8E2A44
MKKIGILIMSVALCTGLNGQVIEQKTLNRIETFIDNAVAGFDIPSVVVGIVEGGKLKYTLSRGEYKIGSGLKVNGQSQYQIASLTKSMTAIIANSLYLSGKLDLDRSIADYVKADLGDEKSKNFVNITLKDVLKHRAALPNDGASIPPTPNGQAMRGGYTKANFLKDLSNIALKEDQIGNFGYSNFGYALIGYILTKETGESYEQLLQRHVLKPYGLNATTSDLESIRSTLVTPYHVHKRNAETAAWEMGMSIPAGGVVSTVSDLSELLIAEMKAFQQYQKDGIVTPLVLTADKKSLMENTNYGYGFFEGKNPSVNNILQLGHGGDVDGFGSFFEFYPDLDLGLILLTSSGGSWFNDLKADIEKLMLGIPVKNSIVLSKAELKKYIGKYDFGKGQVMRIFRRGNYLMTTINGSSPARLFAESKNDFFYKSMNSSFEFELDKKGKISKTIYRQGDQEFFPKKIR